MSGLSKPTSPEPPVLAVEGVHSGYGRSVIVSDVSLAIFPKNIVAIVGPNGAGKSTLMKAIFGLARIFRGSIRHLGQPVEGLDTEGIARLGIGYVPQVNQVFPRLTVRENLEMGGYLHRTQFARQLEQTVQRFPVLKDKLGRRAGTLSGGERTTLAVARAMMAEPSLLLLDEPSAGLSPMASRALWEELLELRDSGVTLLVVEQRTREILEVADWAYVLVAGKNAVDASAQRLSTEYNLGEIFLGGTIREEA